MRKWFGNALHIDVSRSGVTVLHTSGAIRPRVDWRADEPILETTSSFSDSLTARLGAVLAENKCTGVPATIILADDLVRLFVVTPPRNTARLQDCRAASEIRFRTLYGEPSTDWQIDAGWHPSQPFLACGLPKSILIAVRRLAVEHRLTLLEVVPRFIAAWNAWHASLHGSAWFGVAHERGLTVGVIEDNKLCAVRCGPIPEDGWHDLQWLVTGLRREALRLNLKVPDEIQLCGQIRADWSTQTIGPLVCSRLDVSLRTAGAVGAAVKWARSRASSLTHGGTRA